MCFGPCELPCHDVQCESVTWLCKAVDRILDCDGAEFVEPENPSCIASRILIVLNNIILKIS